MVCFSEIHQFPEFLETFPGNFCTIIAAGSKFSKVLVELEASNILEGITFYRKIQRNEPFRLLPPLKFSVQKVSAPTAILKFSTGTT